MKSTNELQLGRFCATCDPCVTGRGREAAQADGQLIHILVWSVHLIGNVLGGIYVGVGELEE